MEKNKKTILSVCLFIVGVIGSGLFAIGQSLSNLSSAINSTIKIQNVCGVLCFSFLIVGLVGLVLIFTELFNKKENK